MLMYSQKHVRELFLNICALFILCVSSVLKGNGYKVVQNASTWTAGMLSVSMLNSTLQDKETVVVSLRVTNEVRNRDSDFDLQS